MHAAGGAVTQLLRIPKLRALLQDACGYNALPPAPLLGSINFRQCVADSRGQVVWQKEHAVTEGDVDAESSAVGLPQHNVKLPSIGEKTHGNTNLLHEQMLIGDKSCAMARGDNSMLVCCIF
jgi:hypothetical protein